MTFLAASVVFMLDRITKMAVIDNMSYGQSIQVLPGIFHFTLTYNTGTAFSIFNGQNALLAAFSLLTIIVICVYIITHNKSGRVTLLALGLILGGAAGNLFAFGRCSILPIRLLR
jgi:signal peptidase II